MKRMLLTISYDGTAYCGWQVQPNGITVQETLQNALLKLTGERANVTAAAARTRAFMQGNSAVISTVRTACPKARF